jgi:hypothetical protein
MTGRHKGLVDDFVVLKLVEREAAAAEGGEEL